MRRNLSYAFEDAFVMSELDAPTARSCKRLGLASCLCKAYPAASGDRRTFAGRHGGLDYATDEAGFEAKAPEGSRTGVGSRRRVFVAGGRRIRSNRAGSGYTVVGHRTASRNHPQRGGNLRRQPGDILCLRQGKRRIAPTRRTSGPRLRRLQRLRQGCRGCRGCAEVAEAAAAAGLRRLRLLLVLGSLPHLLDLSLSDYVDRRKAVMTGFDQVRPGERRVDLQLWQARARDDGAVATPENTCLAMTIRTGRGKRRGARAGLRTGDRGNGVDAA